MFPTPSLGALSPTPSVFKDTLFNLYFEEVVRRSIAAKNAAADLPSFDMLGEFMTQVEETLNTKRPCTNDDISVIRVTQDAQKASGLGDIAKIIVSDVIEDLNKSEKVPNEQDCGFNKEHEKQDNHGMDVWTDKDTDADDEDNIDKSSGDNGNDESEGEKGDQGNENESENERMNDLYPYLLHSATNLECMDVINSDLGCSLKCGHPEKKTILVSTDMINNKKCMEPVLKLRKQLIDYCWLDDHNLRLW